MDIVYPPRSARDPLAIASALAEPPAAERTVADSFEEFYATAFPRVYGFIRCHVGTVETAQELVSRVFVKAYRHRHHAPAHAGMAWVFRIARTTVIDYWRVERKRESARVPIEEIAESARDRHDPAAAYEQKQRSAQLVRVMSNLSEDDRILLALKFTAQRTNREIAAILQISEAAVSMRLLRALRRLRRRLELIGWS